ncbi:EF-hand domain-containing protein [Thalassotalea sp. HSM 43]|uniref:EF-hand domain-containing protein n=1 Tax=Thalassotalea sp. HSM 43 TaxID=2552945 RepID=UPI0010803E14|nr:EF-hand domain-containing protein [Thalassotalea sp. HSM 43]QBY04226.1 EF-hand domain-containing protein [Thalassotalea sp. HSM 43]
MKIKLMALIALCSVSTLSFANQTYFNKLDGDKNGGLNMAEYTAFTKGWMDKKDLSEEKRKKFNKNGFKKIDTDKDGLISFEEFKAHKNKKKKK